MTMTRQRTYKTCFHKIIEFWPNNVYYPGEKKANCPIILSAFLWGWICMIVYFLVAFFGFYNCFPVALWVNCPILDAPLKTSLFWKIKKTSLDAPLLFRKIKTRLRSDTNSIVLFTQPGLTSKQNNFKFSSIPNSMRCEKRNQDWSSQKHILGPNWLQMGS